MNTTTISERERQCLRVLADEYSSECNCLYMRYIAQETKLDLVQVRRSVRSLARKGYAEYHRGLFNDDGQVAGSGYAASFEGAMLLNACIDCKKKIADMTTGQCQECWKKKESATRRAQLENIGVPSKLLERVSLCDLGIVSDYYLKNGIPRGLNAERVLARLNMLVKPYHRHYP